MPDFCVQHISDDVPNTGGSNVGFTPVASISHAFALANNNRKSHAGRADLDAGNLEGDDLAGARVLTEASRLTYYRESGAISNNMRFATSIWEYTGAASGVNEFIVRGRFSTALNGTAASTTETVLGVTASDNVIPFITGIMNNATADDADSGTAIAYMQDATTLFVKKGSNGNDVTVYVTVVEFTGANWTVLHGDSGSVSGDTGTITLAAEADGQGSAASVSDWNNAFIVEHHHGDDDSSGTNDAISDNWPVFNQVDANKSEVDWSFDANHDSGGTNRQFVHVLENAGMEVTRYTSTDNSAGEVTFDITSASIQYLSEALIIGFTESSGGGTAYGRGWRNYYFNSITQAAHWCHRSGNNVNHTIQVIRLPNDHHFTLKDSAHIPAAGSPTTAQLVAPSGAAASDFDAGYVMDNTNPASAVNIGASGFTEMEFAWVATSSACVGETYDFRITANGTPLDVESASPQVTIAEALLGLSVRHPIKNPTLRL